MADECDDPRCGAIFPQGHLPGCRNSSRPPKGRTGWDADVAERLVAEQGALMAQAADDLRRLDAEGWWDATEADRDLYVAKVLWHKEVVLSLDVMQDRYPGSEALQ